MRQAVPLRRLAATIAIAAIGAGCNGTSAKILERIDAATPPGSNLRVDVFLVRSVSTCAVGTPCTARDSAQCFYLADDAGIPRISFDADSTLEFVPPGDPRIQTADRVACFRLTLDDALATSARQQMTELRSRVFQASGGDINLDIRWHEVAAIEAGFNRYYTGIFLRPSTLAAVGLSAVSRETDFVYALTGFGDPDTGLQPKMENCSGTNWFNQGVLGASTYTWMAQSDRCARPASYLATWMIQLYLAMRDLGDLADLYGSNYPACGQGDPDPTRWFPWVDDCTADPDAPACGQAGCPDPEAFYAHVLAKHWPRGRAYNANYCNDGRMDFDETGVDSGGVCDLIGR